MCIKNIKYTVEFTEYSERHYIKNLKKKYRSAWDLTRDSICFSLERLYGFYQNNYNELDILKYSNDNEYVLIKFDFVLYGENKSSKKSGRRVIAIVDNTINTIFVCLVFHHNDGPGKNETRWIYNEHMKIYFKRYSNLLGII